MRRVWQIAMVLALPAGFASGLQSSAPHPANAADAPPAAAPVKVYAPSSSVKAPRLLPLDPPPALTKDCKDHSEGEVLLSLLVDTSGRARNVMLLKPAGSAVDRIAIQIAGEDRFEPGTLDGNPVVVAQALRIKLEGCELNQTEKAGNIALKWALRSMPRQKLEKPKDPPEEAILAPLRTAGRDKRRSVRRPDFFGTGVNAPVMLYSVDAAYTPTKKGAQITGECELGLMVDEHGLPQDIHVIKSLDPGLDLSAMLAVDKYRFFPAIRNGEEPVPASIVVSVKFAPPGFGFEQ